MSQWLAEHQLMTSHLPDTHLCLCESLAQNWGFNLGPIRYVDTEWFDDGRSRPL